MSNVKPIKKLPHRKHFLKKVLRGTGISFAIIVISLLIGTSGYSHFYGLGFYDSFLNASMILTGMGPVNEAKSDSAKLFASIYALYSGIAFLTSFALIISPVIHRFLHRFHLDINE
jgi:hypothetical protein